MSLDVLLPETFRPADRIKDRRDGTVREAQCDREALGQRGPAIPIEPGDTGDRDWAGADQPAREIDEVTPLTEEAATAVLRIVEPMGRCQSPCVHPVDQLDR